MINTKRENYEEGEIISDSENEDTETPADDLSTTITAGDTEVSADNLSTVNTAGYQSKESTIDNNNEKDVCNDSVKNEKTETNTQSMYMEDIQDNKKTVEVEYVVVKEGKQSKDASVKKEVEENPDISSLTDQDDVKLTDSSDLTCPKKEILTSAFLPVFNPYIAKEAYFSNGKAITVPVKYCTFTAMKMLKNWSLEELRYKYYLEKKVSSTADENGSSLFANQVKNNISPSKITNSGPVHSQQQSDPILIIPENFNSTFQKQPQQQHSCSPMSGKSVSPLKDSTGVNSSTLPINKQCTVTKGKDSPIKQTSDGNPSFVVKESPGLDYPLETISRSILQAQLLSEWQTVQNHVMPARRNVWKRETTLFVGNVTVFIDKDGKLRLWWREPNKGFMTENGQEHVLSSNKELDAKLEDSDEEMEAETEHIMDGEYKTVHRKYMSISLSGENTSVEESRWAYYEKQKVRNEVLIQHRVDASTSPITVQFLRYGQWKTGQKDEGLKNLKDGEIDKNNNEVLKDKREDNKKTDGKMSKKRRPNNIWSMRSNRWEHDTRECTPPPRGSKWLLRGVSPDSGSDTSNRDKPLLTHWGSSHSSLLSRRMHRKKHRKGGKGEHSPTRRSRSPKRSRSRSPKRCKSSSKRSRSKSASLSKRNVQKPAKDLKPQEEPPKKCKMPQNSKCCETIENNIADNSQPQNKVSEASQLGTVLQCGSQIEVPEVLASGSQLEKSGFESAEQADSAYNNLLNCGLAASRTASDPVNREQDYEFKQVTMQAERQLQNSKDKCLIDSCTLVRHEKQIAYGKNTAGYQRYVAMIPILSRDKSIHPRTPNKFSKCSGRCWDSMRRKWRKQLHLWDPPNF